MVSSDDGGDSQGWKPMITLVASLIAVDNNFFVTGFDEDFAFRSLGRKISLQIENDDQIDFDDLGNDDDEEEEQGEKENTTNPRRESRGVSQVGYLVSLNP